MSSSVIEAQCRNYYDSYVFGSALGNALLDINIGPDVDVAEVVKNMLGLADKRTDDTDVETFRQEVRSLHLELYGLAWFRKIKNHEHSLHQAIFSRAYLVESGLTSLWELMTEYNRVLAMSTNLDRRGERLPQSEVARSNMERMEFYQHWTDIVCDDPENPTDEERATTNCVARLGNRMGADLKRHDGLAGRMLSAKVLDRLGWVDWANQDALGILHHTVQLLYDDCETNLKTLKL